ncbi:MAG: sodium:solute symporter [Flavobacteriia bacterium]|jgi:SSS family transporter
MSATLIISVLAIYFGVLILISYLTSRNADSETFFTGNKQSPWYLVAFGMIGASLSGVTFISVPGKVYAEGMAYFQIVLGYVLGYLVIAQVLMPLYYRLNVTSIYEYLQKRFGVVSYKTGAGFFILSRTLGSATRLYLATVVLQLFLFEDLGVDYWVTALITIALIWVYTFKGGIKTIVYTDTFQTLFLVSAVVICTVIIAQVLEVDIFGLFDRITSTKTTNGGSMTQIFFFDDPNSKIYFPKQFFGGMFLAIAMTGLDQDLMQKNLTCRSIGDAKKNMYSFTTVLVITNFLFLLLGGALYVYAESKGVSLPMKGDKVITDHVFPTLALNNFGTTAGVFFLLGITASSYASADSALAALTTGFCIDFLNFHKRQEKQRQRLKLYVHIGFSLLFLIIILLTKWYVDSNPGTDLIGLILTVAGYTYGPLLGLFFFGILTKRKLMEWAVPIVCVLAPLLCYWFDKNSESLLNGYKFGNELLIMNGVLTFTGLALISKKQEH